MRVYRWFAGVAAVFVLLWILGRPGPRPSRIAPAGAGELSGGRGGAAVSVPAPAGRRGAFTVTRSEAHGAEAERADRFRQHYARFFTGPVAVGYSNVWEAVRSSTEADPLASDLFKDACSYVAQRTWLEDTMQDDLKDSAGLLHNQVTRAANDEQRATWGKMNEKLKAKVMATYEGVPESLRRVFAQRLRERYQLDPEELMRKLDGLSLRRTGPELFGPPLD